MKVVTLIVQARMGSKRLPKKSILPLAGKPLIFRIMERIMRCKEVNNFVLAIPNTKENSVFDKINFNRKLKIFKGSENNLLERYYLAAKKFKSDIVVRIPGDNCISEPNEIDKIIRYYKTFKKDFFASNLSNIMKNGYPDGIGAEVFGFSLLQDLYRKKLSPNLKEHIHLNFFDYKKNIAKNENWCKVRTIKCPSSFKRPDICLDVNVQKEYKFIKNIYNKLYLSNSKFNIKDVIRLIDYEKKK